MGKQSRHTGHHHTGAASGHKDPRGKPTTGPLADSSQLFASLLDLLEVGVAVATSSGEIVYANARFKEMLGASELTSLVGATLRNFVAASSWADLDSALKDSRSAISHGEMRIAPPHGQSRRVRLSMGPSAVLAPDRTRTEVFIRIIATEVTELIETKKALEDSEASLRNLAAQLLKVQDQERRHMARDLHDITGQELAVAVLSLDRAAKQIEDGNPEGLKTLTHGVQLVRKIESEIRTLSYVLHPPLLDEMGLSTALRWYVDGLTKRTGTSIRLSAGDDIPRFSRDKETALFRVMQEALTNVLRHSHSHSAFVTLAVRGRYVTASVRDEGKGFDVGIINSGGNSGVGIRGMRGRLDLVGGNLEVRSSGHGTEMTATVPLDEGELAAAPLPQQIRDPAAPANSVEKGAGPKRILIADDHEIARRGIRDLFRDQPDLEICGEAENGLEAVEKAQELKPDLIILDLTMPQLGGFGVAYRLRQLSLDTKLLIYSTHSLPEFEKTARAAGCAGYVQKANATRDLVRGVRSVLEGKPFYGEDTRTSHSA